MKLDITKRKHKKALKLLTQAIEKLGGTMSAASILDCNPGLISYYTKGRDGIQVFIPLDKALRISYYLNHEISVEDLLPEYNFKYLNDYVCKKCDSNTYHDALKKK